VLAVLSPYEAEGDVLCCMMTGDGTWVSHFQPQSNGGMQAHRNKKNHNYINHRKVDVDCILGQKLNHFRDLYGKK
jgi:hypothetical protein